MPRIGIDYTAAHEQRGGIGRYVRELIAALAHLTDERDGHYRLFVAGANRHDLPDPPNPNFTWCATPITTALWARIWHRARIPLPIETFTGVLDIFHATDFVLPPTHRSTRTILTVHDLSFVRVSESAAPRLRAYLDRVVPRSVQRANHILADSQATKDDLVTLYDTPEEKITVLLSGVDPVFQPVRSIETLATVRAKYHLPPTRAFVFAVGTIQPRKNYGRLVEAVARLRTGGLDVDLVISGGRGWLEDSTHEAVDRFALRDHVHLIGFADDADLPALYSAARVTATPSLYEGFGLPVLESMACGTPVVTANRSSLPEVAGDVGLLVDPYNVEAIADALGRLISDNALHADHARRGIIRASAFTWQRAAYQLRDVYNRVLS